MRLTNPTRNQKMLMAKRELDPNKYQVVTETATSLIVQHRETKQQVLIQRTYPKRGWQR